MTDNVENRVREMVRRFDTKLEGIPEDVREIQTAQPVDFAEVGRVRLLFSDGGRPRSHSVRLFTVVKDTSCPA
jgi:hypothetical protein